MPNSDQYPIHYHVQTHSISQHLYNVTLEILSPDENGQRLWLPSWIPGSYMVRDFAKNIVSFSAHDHDNKPLNYTKVDKQTWQLEATQGPVVVSYQVYAYDFSIRSAFLDSEFGFFNGTSLFLAVDGQTQSTASITIDKPEFAQCKNWKLASTLQTQAGTGVHQFGRFSATSYQDLIEHPVVTGDYKVIAFSTDNVEFELVLAGKHQCDDERIKQDLIKICHHHIQLFGSPAPVKRYLFQTLLTDEGFGGLEHMSSTALIASRNDLVTNAQKDDFPDGYRTFLSLCSHELFHTWHVKRIKPQALLTANLQQETYTEQLWIYEGFTSYYDEYSLVRADVISQDSYLELLGQALTRLQRNPGRLVQTVTDSSYYTWTKFYKQDENAINAIVSYYIKGAIIALCLDLQLRQQSNNQYNLDHVMVHLWKEFGQTGQGTHTDVIQQIFKQQFHIDVSSFLQQALYSTDELPVSDLLAKQGVLLNLRARTSNTDKGGKPAAKTLYNDFGANYVAHQGAVKIKQVIHGGAACEAGLMVGDILISMARYKVDAKNLQSTLDRFSQGEEVELHVFRRGILTELLMTLKPAVMDTVYLTVKDQEKASQWLSSLV